MVGRPVLIIPNDQQMHGSPFMGTIEWAGDVGPDGQMVRSEDGELTGPWLDMEIHSAYPHEAGTMHRCPGCEMITDGDHDSE